MVKSCCAIGCSNRSIKDSAVSFYRFPSNEGRRALWISAVKRKNWQPSDYSWLCSVHFVGGKKSDDPLSPAYTPTIFNFISSPVKRKASADLIRYERCKVRRKVCSSSIEDELQDDDEQSNESHVMDTAVQTITETSEKGTCTDYSITGIGLHSKSLVHDTERLISQTYSLTEEELKQNDRKVKYYSGLPSYSILMTIYKFVSPSVVNHGRNTLPKLRQFLMTLMKLRLNLADQDLAYRFGVHQSTVSRKFKTWIEAMYIRLKPLIKWPDRGVVKKTMPMVFRNHFRKCICIIDCFEVFCERPNRLKARAQTYSQYKHHNTVKFLIGITPQGSVSFISKGWGGRVSDLHLTEHCGILNNLLPGDLVLADRGFNIQESIGIYCAEVKLPPFTKGKPQLSQLEVDTAREVAHVWIHVERVIGLLRQKFTYLGGVLPINVIMCDSSSDLSMIDKVVVVCCALCNCCESIIPFE